MKGNMEQFASPQTRLVCRASYAVQHVLARVAHRMSSGHRLKVWLNHRIPLNDAEKEDPKYQQWLAAEFKYWQSPPGGKDNDIYSWQTHPDRNSSLLAHFNRMLTGDPDKDLIDLLREGGPYRKALALTSFPELESCISQGIAQEWVINNITNRNQGATADKGVTISYISEDLNFVDLPENEFDLVISDGLLHHIINVDHLALQINKTLNRNGVYIVNSDYVGEEQFKWSPAKRHYLNQLLSEVPIRFLRFPFSSIDTIKIFPLSPFEAITSSVIERVLDSHLQRIAFRTSFGVLFPTLAYLKEPLLRDDNPILRRLIVADQESESLGIRPAFASAVYEKRKRLRKEDGRGAVNNDSFTMSC